MGLLRKIFRRSIRNVVNKQRGANGERKVSSKLNPLLFGRVEHRQIDDFIFADEKGYTHQIDHIEIRENGIFCIETKNYSGWVFGKENQQMWTQTLYREKHQFVNPIKQNRSHIYHLSRILGNRYKINSVIVFVQNNADRINVPYVVNLCDLKAYLANYFDGTHYSIEEMETIYQTILRAKRDDISLKRHIQNVRDIQNKVENNICPRCGAPLVERGGSYGVFYGCSNYPNCTFTKKI